MDDSGSAGNATRTAAQVTLGYSALAVALLCASALVLRGVAGEVPWLLLSVWAGFIVMSASLLFVQLRRVLAAHQHTEAEHQRSMSTLSFALRASRGGAWSFTPRPGAVDFWDGTLWVSDEANALLGYAPGELAADMQGWASLIHPDEAPRVLEQAAEYYSGRVDTFDALYRARQKDGSYRWVNARGLVERDERGAIRRLAGITWDMQEFQTARERATLLGQLFDNSPQGMLLADGERRVIAVNNTYVHMSGVPPASIVGRRLEEVLLAHQPTEVIDAVLHEVATHGFWTGTIDCTRADGRECRAELRINGSRDHGGRVAQFGALVFDITELESSRSQLVYLQNYDTLTQLPNAQLVQHELSEALRRALRTRSHIAVLAIGIDRFHVINESYGRSFGDRLLRIFGERLGSVLERVASAGRLHGDVFAVVIGEVDPREAEAEAERARALLSAGYAIYGETVHLSVSVGVSVFPEDGVGAELLLQRAESALDDAKHQARARHVAGGVRRYRAELSDLAADRVHIETSLRKALLAGGFECHLQPKVRMENGAWVGAEALIRWRLADCWISPARFIPVAEESGLIKDVGRWVLWEAASQLAAWRDAGIVGEDFQVAVNLAGGQLDPDLPTTVQGVLAYSRLPPGCLVLELTETIIMSNPAESAELLRRLRAMGVRISLDDFGTGNTSMKQLLDLPLDELKLDQSFVRGLPNDHSAVAITSSVLAMAEALKLRFIAEGIETEAQRRALIALGCRYGQGHLFGAAQPGEEFARRLQSHLRGPDAEIGGR